MLIPCSSCNHQVSSHAKACPKCGYDFTVVEQTKKFRYVVWLMAIGGVIIGWWQHPYITSLVLVVLLGLVLLIKQSIIQPKLAKQIGNEAKDYWSFVAVIILVLVTAILGVYVFNQSFKSESDRSGPLSEGRDNKQAVTTKPFVKPKINNSVTAPKDDFQARLKAQKPRDEIVSAADYEQELKSQAEVYLTFSSNRTISDSEVANYAALVRKVDNTCVEDLEDIQALVFTGWQITNQQFTMSDFFLGFSDSMPEKQGVSCKELMTFYVYFLQNQ